MDIDKLSGLIFALNIEFGSYDWRDIDSDEDIGLWDLELDQQRRILSTLQYFVEGTKEMDLTYMESEKAFDLLFGLKYLLHRSDLGSRVNMNSILGDLEKSASYGQREGSMPAAFQDGPNF